MRRRCLAVTTLPLIAVSLLHARPALAGSANDPIYADVTGDGVTDRVILASSRLNQCATVVSPGRRDGGYGMSVVHLYPVPGFEVPSACPDIGVAVDLGWDGSVQLVVGWGDGPPPGVVTYNTLVLTDFWVAATLTLITYPGFVGLADFNGDGHPDVYQTSDQGSGFASYLNTASGSLVAGPVRWCASLPRYVLRDFNHNGAMDVLIAYTNECVNNDNGVVVVLDDGAVRMLESDPSATLAWRASVVHANDDGRPDVRTVDEAGRVHTFVNDGSGNFTRVSVR
jgi:hypothetical protein